MHHVIFLLSLSYQVGECCFTATGINLRGQSPDGDFKKVDGGSDGESDFDGDNSECDGDGDGDDGECEDLDGDVWADTYGLENDDDDGEGYEPDELFQKRNGESNAFSVSDKTEASLPQLRQEDLHRINVQMMGALAFQFFMVMFPEVVVLLLVSEV